MPHVTIHKFGPIHHPPPFSPYPWVRCSVMDFVRNLLWQDRTFAHMGRSNADVPAFHATSVSRSQRPKARGRHGRNYSSFFLPSSSCSYISLKKKSRYRGCTTFFSSFESPSPLAQKITQSLVKNHPLFWLCQLVSQDYHLRSCFRL